MVIAVNLMIPKICIFIKDKLVFIESVKISIKEINAPTDQVNKMPHKKVFNLVCCRFCHTEYNASMDLSKPFWHKNCAKATRAKMDWKCLKNKEYMKLIAKPKVPREKLDRSKYYKQYRQEFKNVYIKPEYHLLPCGHWHYNRWNCPQCAERKGNIYNLDFIVEEGASRRRGARLER